MVAVVNPPIINTPPLLKEAVGLTHRQYQNEGVDFLWRTKRAMLTDAPGLGKTPQAVLASEVPVIVVAPTYLTQQWGTWLREHFPKRKVVVAKGLRQEKVEDLLTPADFLIINKEMLRTHLNEVLVVAEKFRYKTVIFDESHHLRNGGARHSRGAVQLAALKNITRCYLLTATPIWKEVDDLYNQLRVLHPDLFKSYAQFVNTWCITDSDRFGVKVYGIKKEMLQPLNEMMDIIRLGRTYDEAKRDLPPIIDNILTVEFTPNERKRYDEAVTHYRLRLEAGDEDLFMRSYMEVMHTLRNLTAFEKIDPIIEAIEDNKALHNGKYVVFAWYRDIAERIAARIPDAILVTGDIKPDERQRLSKLQRPIVATIPSLSEGVDMSWARMVIYAEEHWPPGSQVQSLMRVRRERLTSAELLKRAPHKYGDAYEKAFPYTLEAEAQARQQLNADPILVYCVHVKDSIDELIHATSRRRAASVKEVLKEALGIYL